MANLLTLPEKLYIRKMYRTRLVIVVLISTFVILSIGIITFLPTLFWSTVKEKAASERLSVIKQIISAEEQKNIQEDVISTNKKISLLKSGNARSVSMSDVTEIVIQRKSRSILITAFFYENKLLDEQEQKMTVSGIAQDRYSLLLFVNQLREENIFEEVNLPVSNFVKNTDIPFSLSLLINKNATIQ